MKKIYRVQQESTSASYFRTVRGWADRVVRELARDYTIAEQHEAFDFSTEEEANAFAKTKNWDVTVRSGFGSVKEATLTFWSIVEVILDDEGDEVDVNSLGSWNFPSDDEILNIIDPQDEEEEEEEEE